MSKITLFVNEKVAFDFDKDMALDESQLSFLDKMDSDMNKGIKINGQLFSNPDKHQRAEFTVLNLIRALQQENQAVVAASCAYISNRLPEFDEVHVNDGESGVKVVFL